MRDFKNIILFSAAIITCFVLIPVEAQNLGVYFPKKKYVKKPVPKLADVKTQLPIPLLEEDSGFVEMYWKCWQIAFRGIKSPAEGSPLVSNWIDEAFSENIFQWDTIFMMMFARYAHSVFPAIESLDNFYALQRESGFIGREYRESDGRLIHYDFNGGLFSPSGYKNAVNPPLFAWAEVESFRLTGDKSRFESVLPVLDKYADWLNKNGDPEAKDWENNGRKSKNSVHHLYWNTPLGSGMDNTPRPAENGSGWVEMSAQMAIMYNNLAVIADELGRMELAEKYRSEADLINARINKWCWNEDDGFYYDVLADGTQFRKKTIGAFWTLLAGTPDSARAARLVSHLINPNEFWRLIPFSTLSADEEEFRPDGGYWLGSVWAPTNLMVIKGLEKFGYRDLADEAVEKYLRGMYEVFKDSGTVYENYAPDYFKPGNPAKADFVGWSGIAPIQLLIENILGFRVSGTKKKLTWRIHRTDKHGIRNLHVGDAKVNAVCASRISNDLPPEIKISASVPINLEIVWKSKRRSFNLNAGEYQIRNFEIIN